MSNVLPTAPNVCSYTTLANQTKLSKSAFIVYQKQH